jgi:hypothetical protein
MPKLLEDCGRSPEEPPYVTELDGVRRRFRCRYCKAAEHQNDDRYAACDQCLDQLIDSFVLLVAVEGTVLFRTYNPARMTTSKSVAPKGGTAENGLHVT